MRMRRRTAVRVDAVCVSRPDRGLDREPLDQHVVANVKVHRPERAVSDDQVGNRQAWLWSGFGKRIRLQDNKGK